MTTWTLIGPPSVDESDMLRRVGLLRMVPFVRPGTESILRRVTGDFFVTGGIVPVKGRAVLLGIYFKPPWFIWLLNKYWDVRFWWRAHVRAA